MYFAWKGQAGYSFSHFCFWRQFYKQDRSWIVLLEQVRVTPRLGFCGDILSLLAMCTLDGFHRLNVWELVHGFCSLKVQWAKGSSFLMKSSSAFCPSALSMVHHVGSRASFLMAFPAQLTKRYGCLKMFGIFFQNPCFFWNTIEEFVNIINWCKSLHQQAVDWSVFWSTSCKRFF